MKKVVIWIALSLWSVMTVFAGETAYLFSYFINDSKDGLHLAYSYDGLNWLPLHGGRSYLTPAVGKDKLMRDPSICQSPDGTFHMVWTSSWTDRIIGYASSRDLVHWSEQQAIPVMMHEPDAHNCWAPELFYDEPSQTYYIFWATTIPGRHKEVATSESEKGLNHRIYYVTTKDFRTFSKTKMFFNPDFSVIDAAIVKDPKRKDLIMVVKNENSNPPEKNLRVTRTKKIEKGFPTKVSAPITGKYWAEGPAPLFVGDTLYVYFDKYRDHRYGAVRSLDYGETWEDVSDQVFFPRGIRHGTAFAVDASIVESLIADRNYNPLIPDNLADPSVSKFGDTYYLYGTTDLDYGLGRAGTPVVWKSKDFVNWSFEGSHISGFDWSKGYDYTNDKGEKKKGYFRYWAPGKVIEQDGKFYLYVTFVKPDDKMGTYVLVADRPDGPFHFTAGQGLLPPGEEGTDSPAVVDDIDGEPFINDDGSGYIFWRRRNAGRLSADRLHLDGEPVTLATARQEYSEGPVMFKRKGIYYYIYTLSGHQNYVNAYMMSRESPLTGFVKPEGNDIFLFSSPENQVWGPGHGNVFYDEGTIKTLIPDMRGVGYLAASQETRPNLALQSHFYASSEKSPRTSVVNIETQPNQPLPEKGSVKSYTRTHTYQATHVADESNGTRWMAADTDSSPFITVDLKEIRKVGECQLYFTRPTEGHTWRLEKSIDGKHWQMCAEQGKVQVCSPHIAKEIGETRYLRLHIRRGDAGLWEWKIYE
ncbi:family 43 glycosylhydrolase [Bacteroides ovatus]|uniref:family 43 glycosylhydrolase n=1 Tax=Bacteroides ovatus TaxID=28116 RepID=UPI001B8D4A43|nr:family 43 glycosylhydrolase [Bacteroides ovatus]MCE8877169.1 family 43 glycosylhydrolase [Bacteroides ovatus]QUT83172.1 Glycosyl hydrolases family 43 [Bacteroides ovatus]